MESHSQTGLLLISKLFSEGRITDEDRDKLKGIIILANYFRYDFL